jgi:hypothetical protein
MQFIVNIFNNTIHKKFNRKIGTFFCTLCLVSSSLWILSASAEEPLVFNNKASMDALWAELKADISDLQRSNSQPAKATTNCESNSDLFDFCEFYGSYDQLNEWLKSYGLITILFTYDHNQNIDGLYPIKLGKGQYQFTDTDAVVVTLKGYIEHYYDYIEVNGQRFTGEYPSYRLDQTFVINSKQISLEYFTDGNIDASGVTVTLTPIDRTISTMIDVINSTQSNSGEIGFLDFISALKTLKNTAKGKDSYPQVKGVIAKYQDNLHHITQWLTADSQLKARAAYEPEALMNLAYHINDQSLLQRLKHTHYTGSMSICLSGVSLECMVEFGHWVKLKADIAMDLKQQGETLHTDQSFHGVLQAASDHLDRYSYSQLLVQSISTSFYSNQDAELAEDEFEVGSSGMGDSAAELLHNLMTIGSASASAFINRMPSSIAILSILNQYPGNSLEEKLAAWGEAVMGQINDQSLDHTVEDFSKLDLNDNNKILRSIFHNLSLSSANADDFIYWVYVQNQWNAMNLDVTDLDASKYNPIVILDGINYNSDDEYSLAPKPDNNNGWSIQDKAGNFKGKITLKKQADNRYIVKRFANSSANKFSEVKFYSPDPCGDNPNHYKLTTHWSDETGILTDIGYDCLSGEPVLAVVNKYSAPSYNPKHYDRDYPLPKDFDAWQESLYVNSISYNGLPILESIVHHQKDGQGQQYKIHPLRYESIGGESNEKNKYYLSSNGKILANLLCEEDFLRIAKLNHVPLSHHCYVNGFGNSYTDDSWRAYIWNKTFHHVAWENTNLFIPTKVGLFKTNEKGDLSLVYPLPVIGIEREAKGVKLITPSANGEISPNLKSDYIDLKMQDGQYVPNYITHTALGQGAKEALANSGGNDHEHYFENHPMTCDGRSKTNQVCKNQTQLITELGKRDRPNNGNTINQKDGYKKQKTNRGAEHTINVKQHLKDDINPDDYCRTPDDVVLPAKNSERVFVQNARNSNRDFGCFSFKLGANEPHHSTRNVSTLDYQYVNGGTYALPNINFSIDCDAHNLAVELIPDDQYLGCQITKVDGQWITIFMEFMDNNNKNISFFYYFEEDGFDQIGQYSYILAFNELPPYGSQNGDPQTGYWVDSHEGMFSNADRITAVYMDTQHSQNLSGMFMGATSFTGQNGTSNISNWDVSHTVELDNMFFGARLFNQGLNNWDVSSVQDMDHMFFEARLFNQDLNNWNVANVTHSIEMFRNAIAFDRDLSNWNLAHVNPPNRAGMFDGAINMPNAHMPP